MKINSAAALACMAGLSCFCGKQESPARGGPSGPAPMTVRLAPAAASEAGIVTEIVGVSAVRPSLPLTGTLAARPWTPEEQSALSDAESADAKLKLANASFARLSRLYKDGITARQDLDSARAERDQAQAAAAQADARRANLGLSRESGSFERQAALWGLANLSDVDLVRVRSGAHVDVTSAAFPGVVFPGRVAGVSKSEDPGSRTFTVRIAVDDPTGRLRPQMLAAFAVSAPEVAGLTVPRSAVLLEGDGSYVYIADGGTFLKQRIQTGAAAGDRIQVIAGLTAGQSVVARGAQLLESERLKSQMPPADED